MVSMKDIINEDEEKSVFGLSLEDIEQIAGQIYNRVDNNHPEMKSSGSRFIDILKNADKMNTSSVFIKKVSL